MQGVECGTEGDPVNGCQYCEAANTRCAKLAIALRAVAVRVHTLLAHEAERFEQCPEPPCVDVTVQLHSFGSDAP